MNLLKTEAPPRYYIGIDTETTGVDCERHGICQIGAVACNASGEIVSTFSTDVCPPYMCLIDDSALEVNKFTYKRIANAPDEWDALRAFIDWTKPLSGQTPVPVFQNAPFDVGFLNVAFRRQGVDPGRLFRRVRDTATMSPDVWGEDDYPRSLQAICQRLGIEQQGAHDALHDALNTIKAFFGMKAILDARRGLVESLTKPIEMPKPPTLLAEGCVGPCPPSPTYGSARCVA